MSDWATPMVFSWPSPSRSERFPLGIKDDGAGVRFVDYDIRSQGEEPFTVPTDQRVVSSVLEVNRTGSERTLEASSNEFLEQGVHREEEGEPHRTAGRGALPLPRKEKPGEAVQVVKRSVGAVEAYRFP